MGEIPPNTQAQVKAYIDAQLSQPQITYAGVDDDGRQLVMVDGRGPMKLLGTPEWENYVARLSGGDVDVASEDGEP